MSKMRGGLRQEDHDAEELRKVLDAARRTDLASFTQTAFHVVNPGVEYKHNFHIEAIAHRLEQCRRGEIRRLIITVPPRHLKSLCTSIAYPAFVLGHDPTRRIIAASYSSELADDLSRQFRAVVGSREYRRLFSATRAKKDNKIEFVTTEGGFRYATSVSGTLTGIGGTDIIIDDPLKPEDAMSKAGRDAVISWYKTTLSTRLDDKLSGVIIIVMQRLHVDDLVGHILENDVGSWVHLDLPAIAEEPQEIPLGPVPAEGNLVKAEWLRSYDALPEGETYDTIVQSWDCAAKSGELNDYSVCITFLVHQDRFYVVDVLRERLTYPELKKKALLQHERFAADSVLIEDTGHGTAVIQELRHSGALDTIGIRPEADKITRMSAQSAKIEAGRLFLPTKAPWLEDFKAELLAFPAGRHDDQVDALSQFLGWTARREPIVSLCPPVFFREGEPVKFPWD